MKKIAYFLISGLMLFSSCNKYEDAFNEYLQEQEKSDINNNAEKAFGVIDPKQDWNSIISGSITVTADAPLKNIAKVQILTESPILNQYATILAESKVTKGETVKLNYDAPNAYSRLIAACVDKDGHYHVKGFDVSTSELSFTNTGIQTRAICRAPAGYPDINEIKLESKNAEQSYNAKRAIFANAAAAGDAEKQAVATQGNITQWAGSGWENEMLWKPTENYKLSSSWEVRNNTIMRSIPDLTSEEVQAIKDALGSFLDRTDKTQTWSRKDNRQYIVEKMRESDAVSFYNNQLTSDGTTPITIAPIFMPSSEISSCHLYYYYYDPKAVPSGMSEADYIKALPKFKAIQCWHSRPQKLNKGTGDLYKTDEYLLPYYGDELTTSQTIASLAIPAGYRIGFMLRKLKDIGPFVQNYRDITDAGHGCSYGFGKLNKEINHLPGHFESGMIYFSMEEDDSRVCMIQANGKTYLGFEDGSDCQYNDYIIEVCGYDTNVYASAPTASDEKGNGIETHYMYEDMTEIPTNAYTMCFEDRPNAADYDLNDVVLRCSRVDATTLSLALVATGADDDVVIHGATGWELNDREVHEIFRATTPDANGKRFVNTVVGGTRREVQARYVTVDASMTIPNYMKNIYIENKTTGNTVKIAKIGQPPFAIIVPKDFQYPMEYQPITKAYREFLEWAQNVNTSQDWYMMEDADKIFPSLFKEW